MAHKEILEKNIKSDRLPVFHSHNEVDEAMMRLVKIHELRSKKDKKGGMPSQTEDPGIINAVQEENKILEQVIDLCTYPKKTEGKIRIYEIDGVAARIYRIALGINGLRGKKAQIVSKAREALGPEFPLLEDLNDQHSFKALPTLNNLSKDVAHKAKLAILGYKASINGEVLGKQYLSSLLVDRYKKFGNKQEQHKK